MNLQQLISNEIRLKLSANLGVEKRRLKQFIHEYPIEMMIIIYGFQNGEYTEKSFTFPGGKDKLIFTLVNDTLSVNLVKPEKTDIQKRFHDLLGEVFKEIMEEDMIMADERSLLN